MSRVIIIGAGASRGTLGEQAPISQDFGAFLHRLDSNWYQRYPYLAASINFLKRRLPDINEKSWALDKVWGAIDNRYKLRFILGEELEGAPAKLPTMKRIYNVNKNPWGLAGFELRCVLAKIYGDNLESAIQKATLGEGPVKKELDKLHSGDCVISFNYDLLVEKILETVSKTVNVPDPNLKNIHNNSILLCKPHGSLNWKEYIPVTTGDEKPIEILTVPIRENEIDLYPLDNIIIQPGIAAPVPFKSEIIFPEGQGNVRNFFLYLVEQWRRSILEISKADSLVVIGYGFPSEDLHAQFLFAEAFAKRNPNQELKIHIYEVNQERYKEVKQIIDSLLNPSSCKYSIGYKGSVSSR